MAERFDWSGPDVVIRPVGAVAVFENEWGDAVIVQEDSGQGDQYVVLPPAAIPALLRALGAFCSENPTLREPNVPRDVPRDDVAPRGSLMAKLRKLYPKGLWRDHAWLEAERGVRRIQSEGVKAAEIVAAVTEYSLQQQAVGKIGTQYVLSPAKFFANGTWRGPFPLPATKAEVAQDANLRASEAWLGGAHVAG